MSGILAPKGPRLASLRPLRLYERWEAMSALALATTPLPPAPHRLARAMPALWKWRGNPAAIVVAGARQHPRRTAIVDDRGSLTFGELERETSALACAWTDAGFGSQTTVGILGANGSLVVKAAMAASMIGAGVVYLNAHFSAPQVAETVEHEGVDVLIHDDDLAALTANVRSGVTMSETAVREAIEGGARGPLRPPATAGRVVILTSGTTGRPKGAVRNSSNGSPLDAAGILTCIPIMTGDTTVVPAPLFHGLGLFTTNLALALGSSVILPRSFDAERLLSDITRHRARVLVVVPAMLQRILALPRRRLDLYDVSSLRIVISGGAALSGELAEAFMDRFGEVLYNVYGSTETALATVASPRDLRRAPGTAGRPTPGVSVRIVDEAGERVPAGVPGRVLVGSSLRFEGYTGGGSKDLVDGLMATGDLGHMDRWGRLFIDGREDDMVISGGENVFPAEVEEVLMAHEEVSEAAVVGVQDDDFGERLRAYVVRADRSAVPADELRDWVRGRLARFKTPRDVLFVAELPRTATGKVVKRRLGEQEQLA